jgi:hypothetical protein
MVGRFARVVASVAVSAGAVMALCAAPAQAASPAAGSYIIALFYSDATYTHQVGERSVTVGCNIRDGLETSFVQYSIRSNCSVPNPP